MPLDFDKTKKPPRAPREGRAVAVLRFEGEGVEEEGGKAYELTPPSEGRPKSGAKGDAAEAGAVRDDDASPGKENSRRGVKASGKTVLPPPAQDRRERELIWPLLTAIRSLPHEKVFCAQGAQSDGETARHLSAFIQLDAAYYEVKALRESLRLIFVPDMEDPTFAGLTLHLQRLCSAFLDLLPLASGASVLSENKEKLLALMTVFTEVEHELVGIKTSIAARGGPLKLSALADSMLFVTSSLSRCAGVLFAKRAPRRPLDESGASRRWHLFIEKERCNTLFEEEKRDALLGTERHTPEAYLRQAPASLSAVEIKGLSWLREKLLAGSGLNMEGDRAVDAATVKAPLEHWANMASESMKDLADAIGLPLASLFPAGLQVVVGGDGYCYYDRARHAIFSSLAAQATFAHEWFHALELLGNKTGLLTMERPGQDNLGESGFGTALVSTLGSDGDEQSEGAYREDVDHIEDHEAWELFQRSLFFAPKEEFIERKQRELRRFLTLKKDQEEEYYSWSEPAHNYQKKKQRLEYLRSLTQNIMEHTKASTDGRSETGSDREAEEATFTESLGARDTVNRDMAAHELVLLGHEVDRLGCERELVRRRANYYHGLAKDAQAAIAAAEAHASNNSDVSEEGAVIERQPLRRYDSRFIEDARRIDALKKRRDSFWSSASEMGARAFETWLAVRLKKQKKRNNFLVDDVKVLADEARSNPALASAYPVEPGELRRIDEALSRLFKDKTGGKNKRE